MRAGAVVVVGISLEHAAQMRLAEDDQVVQAFPPYRADQTLDVVVLSWRAWRRGALSDAHRFDPLLECLTVSAIPIADENFRRRVPRRCL